MYKTVYCTSCGKNLLAQDIAIDPPPPPPPPISTTYPQDFWSFMKP